MALRNGGGRRRGPRRGWVASHPDAGACPTCGHPLNNDSNQRIVRTKRGWVHATCHAKEHE